MNCDRDELLEKCRKVDFSAESLNYDKNLEALKSKLAKIDEESLDMKNTKKIRRSMVVAASLAATLSLSVAAFAAAPLWRQLETRITQGEQYVEHFERWVSEDGATMGASSIDPDASVPIIIEVDGEEELIMDIHHFDNLNEALSLLAVDDPMLPSYLPEGFTFQRATFSISPIRNPENPYAANSVNIVYSNDKGSEIQLLISYYPAEWGGMSIGGEEITINGHRGEDAGGWMFVHPEDTLYSLSSRDVDSSVLIRIAESLFQ